MAELKDGCVQPARGPIVPTLDGLETRIARDTKVGRIVNPTYEGRIVNPTYTDLHDSPIYQ